MKLKASLSPVLALSKSEESMASVKCWGDNQHCVLVWLVLDIREGSAFFPVSSFHIISYQPLSRKKDGCAGALRKENRAVEGSETHLMRSD